MTGKEFVESNMQPARIAPYPEFIFHDKKGRILGEYVPTLKDDRWSGGDQDTILRKEILSWYITWDQHDIDAIEFVITIGDEADD